MLNSTDFAISKCLLACTLNLGSRTRREENKLVLMAADSESSLCEFLGPHAHNREEGLWLGRATVKRCFRCGKVKSRGLQSGQGAAMKRCFRCAKVKSRGLQSGQRASMKIFFRCGKVESLGLQSGQGAAMKRCFRCGKVKSRGLQSGQGASMKIFFRCGKVESLGLQSGQGSLVKHPMDFRVKEEEITITRDIKPKTIHTSAMAGLGNIDIRDVIVIDNDSDGGGNGIENDREPNTEINLINRDEVEVDDHDASSSESIGQNFNHNSHQIPKSANPSKDKNDCDSVDSEVIMEGSYGKLHKQWKQAALKKQVLSEMEYKRPYIEEEAEEVQRPRKRIRAD